MKGKSPRKISKSIQSPKEEAGWPHSLPPKKREVLLRRMLMCFDGFLKQREQEEIAKLRQMKQGRFN